MDNKQNTNGGSRSITIRVKLPVFVAALIVLLAGLIWIFILGVMVGRGYNTREHLGPLAIFVPGPPSAEATGELSPAGTALQGEPGSTQGQTATAGQSASMEDLEALFKGETLLRSEDLDFKENLQSQPDSARSGSVAGTPAHGGTAQTTTGTRTDARPQPPARAETQSTAAVQAPAQAQPQTPNVQAADTAVYEFIYQVSSYNQLHHAQNLTQRLNTGGIPAQIELHKTSAATWYRVLVSFTGREAELTGFQQKLKQFNLSSPLLRKKKAVAG